MKAVREEIEIVREHSGPLPPPDLLAGYEAVQPGLAERIVMMAEREQLHRFQRENTDLKQGYSLARTGQVFGLVALVVMAALAGYLGHLGHANWAFAVASVDIAAVVAIFVTGQWRRQSEEQQDSSASQARSPADEKQGEPRQALPAGQEGSPS